jgi:uncharacterized membrane protein
MRGGSKEPGVLGLLLLLHLVGLALGMGALVCQLVLLERHKSARDPAARIGSEEMARAVITFVLAPGVYLALASGVGLAALQRWEPFTQGWFHFKLLFVFWIVLATRLLGRNAAQIQSLREQCGHAESERLRSLKGNHARIGYVTVLGFVFVIGFSLWKPF